jgi:hypothetical protein
MAVPPVDEVFLSLVPENSGKSRGFLLLAQKSGIVDRG